MKTRDRIVWLVRHAEAVDADAFDGPDMERPLTKKGRDAANAAFRRLAAMYGKPGAIVSSEAVRAVQTARLLDKAFSIKKQSSTPALNPGCRFRDIMNVALDSLKQTDFVVLVGHEPDLSDSVSRWTSRGNLSVRLKKGAVAELVLNAKKTATLQMLIYPEVLG